MLAQYGGTLLVVSHDRYLLNAVTNKTLGLTGDGGAVFAEGNYATWREAQQDTRTAPPAARTVAAVPPPPTVSARDLSKARIKAREAVERAERAVQTREIRLAEVEAALSSGHGNGADLVALAAEHTRLRTEVDAAITDWERAVADVETLG
jgi:ATPase subunit of ABC transporter with duplicated ATPase domains